MFRESGILPDKSPTNAHAMRQSRPIYIFIRDFASPAGLVI